MRKKLLSTGIILIMFLSSCTTNNGLASTPTSTAMPIVQPTATSHPYVSYPTSVTSAETVLYAGPDNLDFDSLATLAENSNVFLLGIYVDFVKVYDPVSNQEGFVWKDVLKTITPGLSILNSDEVPRIETDYIADSCTGPFTKTDENGVVTITDYQEGPGNFGLEGAPIQVTDDTQFIFDFESQPNAFWIALADTPYRPFDNENWMLGYRKITVYRNNLGYDGYQLEFRDGNSANAILFPLDKVGNNPFKLVFLDSKGEKFEVRDMSEQVLYTFEAGDIEYDDNLIQSEGGFFPQESLVISCADYGPTQGKFNQHTMSKIPTGVWQEPEEEVPSLKELSAANGLENIIFIEPSRLGNKQYLERYKNQASIAYLNDMSVKGKFWLGIDQYNFDYMDNLLAYYKSEGYKVLSDIGYGRVNKEEIPSDLADSQLSKDEYVEILHRYISTLACRYKDQVDYWEIASESLGNPEDIRHDFWGKRIGPEYVDMAFQWVDECDPDAVLMVVDTIDSPRDESMTSRLENVYQRVKSMVENDIPIDAVGFEGHLFLPWDSQEVPNKEDIVATMKKFGDLGLDVYITEMDVDLSGVAGSEEEKFEFQAEMYKMFVDACLEAGNCKSFGVFGIDDAHSWLMCSDKSLNLCPPAINPQPLLYDADYKPKPAFWAVVQSLQDHQ